MFVLEASILPVAIEENGKAATMERYRGAVEQPHISLSKYYAIHSFIGAGTIAASWKLQHNSRKPVRVCGHVLIWGVIAYYSTAYFTH